MRQAPVARSVRALSTTSHVLMAGSLALAIGIATLPAAAQGAPAGQAQQQRYDIPAGPLDQSLNQFAAQSRSLLVVDPEITRGKQGPALSGSYSHERALELLLSGSGLQAERRADGGIVIQKRAAGESVSALPTVSVVASSDTGTGLKRAAAAGALGARSVLDTPFSISVVDKEDIQDRQVSTIEQAFRFDPSVTSSSGEYGRGSSILVRGLGIDATNGFKVDGLAIPGWGNELLPMEMFERVELLKGLTGFMYGFGSPGGIMNYVQKRATEEDTFAVDVGYKSGSLRSEHIDIGGRAGDKKLGYRVNLVHEQGGTYFNGGELVRDAASLALDLKMTPDLTWSFDTLYAKRQSKGNAFWGYALGAGLAIPTVPDPSTKQQPEGSYYDNENIMVTTGLQWRINDDWKSSISYRYSREDVDYVYSTVNITNAAGATSSSQSAGIYGFQFQQLQAMLEGRAKTGAIGHQLAFGVARQQYQSLSDRAGSTTAIGTGNLYRDTTLSTGGVNNSTHTQYRSSEITQDAIFASDTLSLGERWSIIAGLRYTRFNQEGYNTAGATTSQYKRNPLTPTIALMFKPTADTTLYGSYVEALERGGTAGFNSSGARTLNYNEVMGPIKSKQVELGVKTERAQWMTSAALFRIQRAAEYVNTANYYVQDGETRYQGLDVSGRYDLTPALSLSGGAMWLDAKYQQTTAALEGRDVVGTPRFQATASVRYRVPQVAGLSLNAGGRYVGISKLNSTTNMDLPAYHVFDAGAIYRTRLSGKDVTFNAQIQNLTDRRYWVYNGTNYLFAGAPRTLSLNARIEF
ncbi:TonB-dependent siderophore receptor [Herbaspirillum sp. alder98]|uniref:TonB-dependent siderophore receptor n=1 Tax=Herbaspirillum sp. alder98 TaxID=2913096 RepID=UPI001CD8DBBB|nr:TonB-dependent receptor [Herbaspirillum sp. alder98]MCA1323603.1 TonB-dependent receptor [Herbaspirillum sp. alder98]